MLRPLAPHPLRSGLTLAFVVSLSGVAGAQSSGAAPAAPVNECEVDADCGHGFACQATLTGSGGGVATGGAAGAGGASQGGAPQGGTGNTAGGSSDPIPPMSTGGSSGTSGGVAAYVCGDMICQQPYESQATCPVDCGSPMVWKYCAPAQCNEPADCAEGYRCNEPPVAGTGGASSVPSFCGDGVCFQPENSMTCPEDCTSLGYCEPEMTECTTSAQCPAGFYCSYDFGTGGAAGGTASGSGGIAGAAGTAAATGGVGGTGSGFAPPDGAGGTTDKAAPLPPEGGTSGTAGSSGSTGVGGSMAGSGGVGDIAIGYCLPGGTGGGVVGGAGGSAGTGMSTGGTGNVGGTVSAGGSAGTGVPCPGGGCGPTGSGGSSNGGTGDGSGGSGANTSGGTTSNSGGSNPGSAGSGGSAGGTKDVVTHAGCSVSTTREPTSPFTVFALLGAALALTRRRAPRAARR